MTPILLALSAITALLVGVPSPRPLPIPAPIAAAASTALASAPVRSTALALSRPRSARPAANGLRVAYGKPDQRGCERAVVWNRDRRVARIPSAVAVCSRLHKHKAIFGRLYFDWVTIKTTGTGRKAVTRKLTDLWVTDGTTAGTLKVKTLHESAGRGVDTCESRWARAGFRAIAGAQWCREGRTRTWVSGSIAIILDESVVRYLPVPRMLGFQMAARRIVTTGEDAGGREIWVHDRRMTRVDVWPGPHSSYPRQFVDQGDTVSFIANDGTGAARWVTDGTVKGTRKVGPVS